MDSNEHMKLFGINLSTKYIDLAKQQIQEHDELWGLISDEANENLSVGRNTYLGNRDMIGRYFVCGRIASHCIGMGFEILYKTVILREGGTYPKCHKIEVLHKILGDSKENFSRIIIEHGWHDVNDFIRYFDNSFAEPGVRYFESITNNSGNYERDIMRTIRLFGHLLAFVKTNVNY